MTASITISGNLTRDPELRQTSAGQVATLSIADTARRRNAATGAWEDGDTSYYVATAWNAEARNAAESLHRGDRVLIAGRTVEREFTLTTGPRAGEKVRRHEIVVDEIGVSLRFATATPVKVRRADAAVEDEATA